VPSFGPLVLGEAVLLLGADRTQLTAGLMAARVESEGIFSRIGAIGAAALLGVGAAATTGIGMAVKSAADLEFAIDSAGAVGQATVQQMEQMKQQAMSLSQSSIFGATEIVRGMETIIKAGVDVEDVLNGAAEAAVILAQAGGTTLSRASDVMATMMALWGDAGIDLTEVINRIAAAANESRFDVDDLSLAIGMGGAQAVQSGVSWQDFLTIITATAQGFNSGSDAGTSFKTFLMRLNPYTDKAAEKMRELGIITEDGKNQFFDANGELRSMADIVDILHNSVANLSEEERILALRTIFQADAQRMAALLAGMTREEYEQLNATLGDISAADIATQRLDNVRGAMLRLLRTIQAVGLNLGGWILKQLNVQDAIEGVTDTIRRMAIAFEEGFTGIDNVKLGGNWGPWVEGAKEAGRILREDVTPALQDFGNWIQTSAIPAITNFGEEALPILKDFGTWLVNDLLPALWDFANHDIWPKLEWAGRFFVDELVPAVKELGEALEPVVQYISENKEIIGGVVAGWIAFKVAIMGASIAMGIFGVTTAIAASPVLLLALAIAAVVAQGVILYKNWETINEFGGRFHGVVGILMSALLNLVAPFHKLILIGIGLYKNWDEIKQKAGEVKDEVVRAWDFLTSAISNNVNRIIGFFKEVDRQGDAWKNDIISDLTAIKDFFGRAWDEAKRITLTAWNGMVSEVKNIWNGDFKPWISNLPGNIKSALGNLANLLLSAGRDLLNGLKRGAEEGWNSARSWFTGLPNTIRSSIGNLGTALYQAGRDLMSGLVSGVTSMVGSVISSVTGAVGGAVSGALSALGIGSPSKVFREIGMWTMEGFAQGILGEAKMVANTLDTVFSKLPEQTTLGMNNFRGFGPPGRALLNATGSIPRNFQMTEQRNSERDIHVPVYIGGKVIKDIWIDGATGAIRSGRAPHGVLNK
jgi:TP901 family phage tail tape measure protein